MTPNAPLLGKARHLVEYGRPFGDVIFPRQTTWRHTEWLLTSLNFIGPPVNVGVQTANKVVLADLFDESPIGLFACNLHFSNTFYTLTCIINT
ncbi:hypothetical protein H5410_014925, partial [Solanum commersonii]